MSATKQMKNVKPPPMKDMLTDMYEMCNKLLEDAGITHDAVLVTLKRGSNAKFLQINIGLMMTLIQELLENAKGGCGECKELIKELQDEKDSWQDGEFKLTKLLSEEREKNVDLLKEIEILKKDNKMLDVRQAKATYKATNQMEMRKIYEKQFDNLSQELNKLRQQLDKIDN